MNFDCPNELKEFKFFKEISELQTIVTLGVQEAYLNAVLNYADEKFYAFGINIPSDLGALYFGGNTEENFMRITAQDKRSSYYDRWSWHEWGAYEVLEPQPLMASTWQWVHDRFDLYDIEDEELGNLYFEYQERAMYACAIKALKENDEAGVFGDRSHLNNVTLYASAAGFNEYYFLKSVKALNSEVVWAAIRQEFLPHMSKFSDEAKQLLM